MSYTGEKKMNDFLQAVHTKKQVSGLTHSFYRYPARFSPRFARAGIEAFTRPGEVVLDPFMGGGTTLVEARALGRSVIGTDISSLSTFITKVKTTPLTNLDILSIKEWAKNLDGRLNLFNPSVRPKDWIEQGYQYNINSKDTWRIRKSIELYISYISELPEPCQQDFTRCALLSTAQWALDCRRNIPTVKMFRTRLKRKIEEMIVAINTYSSKVEEAEISASSSLECTILNQPATDLPALLSTHKHQVKANLVLTSPPYPGVYVLYHRWKVKGRKETPAPFWIAASKDGHGQAYYTLGDRRQKDLTEYFEGIYSSYQALHKVLEPSALVVQLIAFSDPSWQIDRYLETMSKAGYREILPASLGINQKGRIWREVPGRKWFANIHGELATSKELVLFHKPKE